MGINGNWEKTRTGEVAQLGEIGRRRFIALSGASAAALVFGAGPFAEGVEARPRFSGYPFTLGVASGDPQPDGAVIWTRAQTPRRGRPRRDGPQGRAGPVGGRLRRAVPPRGT